MYVTLHGPVADEVMERRFLWEASRSGGACRVFMAPGFSPLGWGTGGHSAGLR